MSVVLTGSMDLISNRIFQNLPENAVVFTSDYHFGKDFLKREANEEYRYYYFYKGCISDMENEENIVSLQKKFLQNHDYAEAKQFNDFLVNITRIKKLKKWLYYPTIIQLEHTNRCNARCIMCGHANVDKSLCFDMDKEVFNKIETLLPFCKYVGLHGYGEPFLTRDLEEYFKIYKKYGVRLYANTNLSYIPDKFIPYIAEMFDELNISIDGFTAETFEFIRRGISFDSVVKNLQKVTTMCPSVKINFHVTLMRQNIMETIKAVELAHSYGVKKIVFNEMIPLSANDNASDSIRNYMDISSKMIKIAVERAIKLGIEILYPVDLTETAYNAEMARLQEEQLSDLNIISHEVDEKITIKKDGLLFNRSKLNLGNVVNSGICSEGICDVFQQQIYVDADGAMAACCVDGFHKIGNIMQFETINQYWESDCVKMITECFEKGMLPAFCKKCNYVYLHSLKNLKVYDECNL